MKGALRFGKLLLAFLLLAVACLIVWSNVRHPRDLPDRAFFVLVISFAVSATILWIELLPRSK
jgi:hypothetical protein